ncbi:hypothetical protein [Nocardioides sp.]|uniref:hypothetical protein n=1 Tax=Nocardioides sp. TaxID=35761 RepID=UPI002B5CEDA6|nr:hypothetical protein [Nocardioides sp.]HSX68413.1 hypothetical protein [Nocardioides sp.]
MSDEQQPEPEQAVETEPAWKRKARLAAIFGDVVPDSTSDDRDDEGTGGTSEEWLKRQVPPHHG